MMKSLSWSIDSGSEQSRVRGLGDSKSKSKSKSRSSPTWSKDSVGSELAKSLEVVKKSEEVKVESGSSSEIEEGELEPEVEREPNSVLKRIEVENEAKEITVEVDIDLKVTLTGEKVTFTEDVEKEGHKKARSTSEGKNDGLHEIGENLNVGSCDGGEEKENADATEGGKEEEQCEGMDVVKGSDRKEGSKDIVVEKSLCLEKARKEEKGIDLEVKADEAIEVPNSHKDQIAEENRADDMNMYVEMEDLSQNFKDKGKSVTITSNHIIDSAEDEVWTERESMVNVTWKADNIEGPGMRGFDLFTRSPVRKTEEKAEVVVINKETDEKLELEPLDLSLSLPNVLLPLGATQAPVSPSHGRSVDSLTNTFCTNSDGFTASMSFSGSQSFFHNPSCSLTQNSMDNLEQTVHSRPVFQGIDQASQGAWQGQSQNEFSQHKEIPLYQRILTNGNASIDKSKTSFDGIHNGQPAPGQNVRVVEGSTKIPKGLDMPSSFQKQNDVRSPSKSIGSHDIGSSYSFEKKRAMREKHSGGNLYRSSSQKERELLIGGADFVETIISRIVTDPIHVMARKFHEMNGQSMACLKESIHESMLNADKKAQLRPFQNAVQCRSDMGIEVLSKCHRVQLEILVALKTGLPEYLQVEDSITSTDLAEVFLYLRCRNLTCRSPLPVDECDCKVCTKKNGFCNACMCLLCLKFDMGSKTCSWVGCDVCLHWCHTDCGLRESYIRNGRSAIGAQRPTEMQFHCVACDHPSEMFGFVKEVFQNFSVEWSVETMSKELEYVKRIFSASEDVRGRRLHEIADQMLVKLSNKSDLPAIINFITGFLTDIESSNFANTLVLPEKEQLKKSNGIAGPSHDMTWLKSVYSDKSPQFEGSASVPPSFYDRNDKCTVESELHKSAQKEPLFDNLESIVRIKQEEAKMFQKRADAARREAEGLKRSAIAKNEKIEEQYTSRITKLHLVEAEEMREQKFEEFQVRERTYGEYFNMKMRMEADIKDLLLEMEATRWKLSL